MRDTVGGASHASSKFLKPFGRMCVLVDVYNMKPASPFVNTGKYVVPLISPIKLSSKGEPAQWGNPGGRLRQPNRAL